jgi:DNA-binding response OmpR family regulator
MRKLRILIVDDEPGLVRLMTLMLTSVHHYDVHSVTDATLALEAAVKFKPHLVILDWIMPKMHGGDVARQIRANPRVCDTRILFLSAITTNMDSRGEIAGFPAIAKPVGMHELVEAIEEQLREIA